MALFERCAALLLAELDAREAGDRLGADALRAERDAIRTAWEQLGDPEMAIATGESFPEALAAATTELEHREAVEQSLRELLAAIRAADSRTGHLKPRAIPRTPRGGGGPWRDPPPPSRTLDVKR